MRVFSEDETIEGIDNCPKNQPIPHCHTPRPGLLPLSSNAAQLNPTSFITIVSLIGIDLASSSYLPTKISPTKMFEKH